MESNPKYLSSDLVAIVWPRQSEPAVRAGEMTWEEAAGGEWAIDSAKAERSKVLVAIHDDVVVGAWRVTAVVNRKVQPVGKGRHMNRSRFVLVAEPRLTGIVGARSPYPRRRNPQTTVELRDFEEAAAALLRDQEKPAHGAATLGEFILRVSEDGNAELFVPAGAVLKVRTAA
jgi:hypothetical protein